MKKFVRTKKINGKEYEYEITPYYDPATKQTKQHSKYLGVKVDGKISKVRVPKLKDIISYGEFLPLLKMIEEYNLEKFLTSMLGEEDSHAVLTLSMFKLLTHLAFQDTSTWYKSSYLQQLYGELPLSSQKISRLLEKIGNKNINYELSKHIIPLLSSKHTIFYDITSISSFSEKLQMLEWGYNRDGYDLSQVNLSVMVDKSEGIPISYELYPGSISDVKTIQNTMKRICKIGITDYTLVLDRGFYSNTNIEDLINSKENFIIALPERYTVVDSLLREKSTSITDANNGVLFENELLFVEPVTINTGNHPLKAYVYYAHQRAQKEEDNFYKRLIQKRKKIEEIKDITKLEEKAKDILGDLYKYFNIIIEGKTVKINIIDELVKQRTQKQGMFIIAYSDNFTWDEVLSLYRSKQLIEMSFDILKNDLDISTPQVHKSETLRGLMFVSFLALIFHMRILKLLKDNKLQNEFSFNRVILELQKLKIVNYENGDNLKNETTKKQRDLLKLWDIVPN